MTFTNAIYLDTQALYESRWPEGSPRLREFCTLARNRGIPELVPAPVLQELEQQFLERVEAANETIRAAQKAVEKLNSVGWQVGVWNDATELERYRDATTRLLRDLFNTTVPVTTAAAAELFERALTRGRPFHVAGDAKHAGVKDAVILRTICDDVQRRGLQSGGLRHG